MTFWEIFGTGKRWRELRWWQQSWVYGAIVWLTISFLFDCWRADRSYQLLYSSGALLLWISIRFHYEYTKGNTRADGDRVERLRHEASVRY